MTEETPNAQASAEPSLTELGRALFTEAAAPARLPGHSWQPPTPEELQAQLPQYEILDRIGRGGMGAVYLASQSALDRLVAVKILSAELDALDPGFSQRFKNEARAMARLSHPGIVAIHEFGETPSGLHYIVMEFIEGTNVQQMITASRRLHTEHALAITAHVCDALHYAHERGIIHRDIKPANIIVGYDGSVKVADFGLAKVGVTGETHQLTRSGTTLGTPHYIAPEALVPGAQTDHRADIYATGVMLYHMLTGKLPQGLFELPSIQVPGLDPRLDAIIARAMREDRDLRYATAAEMRADLDGILTQPIPHIGPGATLPAEVRPQRSGAKTQPQTLARKEQPSIWKWAAVPALAIATLGGGLYFLEIPSTDVSPATSSAAPLAPLPLPPATRDQPFINSLGMKFVPVPGTKVLFCIHETRYRDYTAFAQGAAGVDGTWKDQMIGDLSINERAEDQPVMRVSWEDAQRFCAWLSHKEGRRYRLPSDKEWSQAAGIGHTEEWAEGTTPSTVFKDPDLFPWGTDWPPPPGSGNFSDESLKSEISLTASGYIEGYDDGFPAAAPVMNFAPNVFGLYDMSGNVWEMVQDWFDDTQRYRAARGGGCFVYERHKLLASFRNFVSPLSRGSGLGFRVVLEDGERPEPSSEPAHQASLQEPPSPVSSATQTLPPATKDQPFINTLGMKFVPVPGTDTLFCIHETRHSDYAVFAEENPGVNDEWKDQMIDGWKITERPGDHPVIYVNWHDAQAFCRWLSQKEERAYRLPTYHEWSFAVGVGHTQHWDANTTTATVFKQSDVFPWGRSWPPPHKSGNYSDLSRKQHAPGGDFSFLETNDGYPTTAPVMSFPANEWGLHDMMGNVWEWLNTLAPSGLGVLRGASFTSHSKQQIWSYSSHFSSQDHRRSDFGFRLALSFQEKLSSRENKVNLPTDSASSSADDRGALEEGVGRKGSPRKPALVGAPNKNRPMGRSPLAALPGSFSKDSPFVNSLGMKFVPMPDSGILFCVHETRRKDYASYARENPRINTLWQSLPIHMQEADAAIDEHPVVNLSWHDANDFCSWLSGKEGRLYRLPTDQEWSFAAGIGHMENWEEDSTPHLRSIELRKYPWACPWPLPSDFGNYGDASYIEMFPTADRERVTPGYDDGFPGTAPVMSFSPNELGIYDLGGNAWEWVKDHPNPSWLGSPRVMRGSSFLCNAQIPFSTVIRGHAPSAMRKSDFGFRVVLEGGEIPEPSSEPAHQASLQEPPSPVSSATQTLPPATKDQPFINTLGMKFVPVPGTDTLFCIHETRCRDYAAYAAVNPAAVETWPAEAVRRIAAEDLAAHPMVHVNGFDARAFCAWLSRRENRLYRLPTDREWSIASGIGEAEKWRQYTYPTFVRRVENIYPWGTQWPPPSGSGNLSDVSRAAAAPPDMHGAVVGGYEDGFAATSPVMSFSPNRLGLYDMSGNVWELMHDWGNHSKEMFVIRGGAYTSHSKTELLASSRLGAWPYSRDRSDIGFRIVLAAYNPPPPDPPPISPLDLSGKPAHAPTPTSNSTSRDASQVLVANSLGMEFTPVPGTKVLFSVYETRWIDYAAFAAETPALDPSWKEQAFNGISVTGLAQYHPVTYVSWLEARDFCQWLTSKERAMKLICPLDSYRLPTDSEWSHAIGIGDLENENLLPAQKSQNVASYPWGDTFPPGPEIGNLSDLSAMQAASNGDNSRFYFQNFNDGYPTTAPVGSFGPNVHGIFDLVGNVGEWCQDWHDNERKHRVVRGSCWASSPGSNTLLSSFRSRSAPYRRSPYTGFRIVLEREENQEASPAPTGLAGAGAGLLSRATAPPAAKAQPFINTLGMKFVPVPGTDTLFCIHETRYRDYAAYAAVNPTAVETWPQNAVARLAEKYLAEHPMTNVNGFDARAFCAWLSRKENRLYRLPTDREWSLAAGIGEQEDWGPSTTPTTVMRVQDVFPWGTGWPPPPGAGNYSDQSRVEAAPPDMQGAVTGGYSDGFPGTAPVMSFPPNKLGLYDMGGNVWEIVHDWSNHSKESHVMRGASFMSYATGTLLASMRLIGRPELRMPDIGFRIVLASSEPVPPIPPAQTDAPGSSPVTAVPGGAPPFFKNSLDMVFLPVPGTKVLFSIYETRWMDYAAFASETPGLDPSWKDQSFQGITIKDMARLHPVIRVSWLEADQFCQWLTAKEREQGRIGPQDRYRLPTDAEWSHAAGIGDQEDASLLPAEKHQKVEAYPWPGGRYPPGPGDGNFADRSAMKAASSGHYSSKYFQHFDDGYPTTAPVGRFKPNTLGLFDLAGNVAEWCQDGYDKNQRHRVVRGTAWAQGESSVHTMSSFRSRNLPTFRTHYLGFRVVLERAED